VVVIKKRPCKKKNVKLGTKIKSLSSAKRQSK